MADNRAFQNQCMTLSHSPTVLLIIGYIMFWNELYFIFLPNGKTSPLSWIIWISFVLGVIVTQRSRYINLFNNIIDWFDGLRLTIKMLLIGASAVTLGILGIITYVSSFPPHLIQESDTLTYHITVPRQHLLRATFEHISWSTADLYYLPLDFAIAPYWLATNLPNKWPQLIFLFGLIIVAMRLSFRINRSYFSSIIVCFAIIGTHSIGIQMGIVMLDIAICYLFIAFVDSLLSKSYAFAAIEFTLFFWSKSFIPFQIVFVFIVLGVVYFICQKLNFRKNLIGFVGPSDGESNGISVKTIKKMILLFIGLSIFLAGPFMVKSLSVAGTPVFPLKPFLFNAKASSNNPVLIESIKEKALEVYKTRTQYGSGRSLKEFLVHLWLIAVPEKDMRVNNRYDYPLGLTYLLFIGPFLILTGRMLFEKNFGLLPVLIIVYWISWWMLTQQSRFLFIPVILMFITVAGCNAVQSRLLLMMLIVALLSTLRSVYGAHHDDFGKSRYEVLRSKDKELIEMTKNMKDDRLITLDYPDVAYAGFPVDVRGSESIFVLKY